MTFETAHKYKEVYKVNINIIKTLIRECEYMEKKYSKERIKKKEITGNLYMLFDK